MTSFYRAIGLRVREFRCRKGWRQQELGAALGISHAAVSDIERGKTKLNVDTLVVIAATLDVSVCDLLRPVLEAAYIGSTDTAPGRWICWCGATGTASERHDVHDEIEASY